MKNFVEELRWRGMIHDMTPGTEDQLNKEIEPKKMLKKKKNNWFSSSINN